MNGVGNRKRSRDTTKIEKFSRESCRVSPLTLSKSAGNSCKKGELSYQPTFLPRKETPSCAESESLQLILPPSHLIRKPTGPSCLLSLLLLHMRWRKAESRECDPLLPLSLISPPLTMKDLFSKKTLIAPEKKWPLGPRKREKWEWGRTSIRFNSLQSPSFYMCAKMPSHPSKIL